MKRFYKTFLLASFSGLSILGTLSLTPACGQTLTTLAGNCASGYSGDGGPANLAPLWVPDDIAFDSAGNYYIADAGSCTVRKVTIATGIIQTVAGNGTPNYTGDGGPATLATLEYPSGVALDAHNNLYIADYYNNAIREVFAATGVITTIIGNGIGGYTGDGGPASLAEINNPERVRFDSQGNLYIADSSNYVVRKVSVAGGIITTFAGNGTMGYSGDGGPATLASLNSPQAFVFDASGNVFITDPGVSVVRMVSTTTGVISTVVGNGTSGYSGDGGPATLATLSEDAPDGIAMGCQGNLFLTDDTNNVVRMVDKATGIISTVIGTGQSGCSTSGTPVLATNISHPESLAFDPFGNLYLVDYDYSLVQFVAGGFCPGTPTPTPSATSTRTSTMTPTNTPTITLTPTLTPSRTATDTPTLTDTPTITLTPFATLTATPTHLATNSPTPTQTSSVTAQVTGPYTVNVGVYNEAGELIDQIQVVQSSQSVNSLNLQGNTITSLTGANGKIYVYSQGYLLGVWNGTGSDGNPVSNGVYFIKANSIDPNGVVSTVTQQATVSRSLAKISVNVYNEAGEVVKHLFTWVDDPLGTQMTSVVLSSSVLRPGTPADADQPSNVQIVIQTSGAAVTLSWDGTNDNGAYVTAGYYLLEAHWFGGQGTMSDISKGILVTANGNRSDGTLIAQPNILTASIGITRTTFKYYSSQSLTLRVKIYTLAGELTAEHQGEPGTNQASWNAAGYASGLYLAAVDLLNNDGGRMGQQILKVMILR